MCESTPDIVIVEGVRPNEHETGMVAKRMARLRSKVTVHIVEVGYAADEKWSELAREKEETYGPLMRALKNAGWKATMRTVIVGATGYMYEHVEEVLE